MSQPMDRSGIRWPALALGMAYWLGHWATATAQPRLRVDAGHHMGAIVSLSGDAGHRYLASSGSDQTIRVWDARRGSLLRTLYPHAGAAAEQGGALAALSADGQLLAIAQVAEAGAPEPTAGVALLQWSSGQQRYHFEVDAPVARLLFAPDSPVVGTAAEGGGRLAVLSTRGAVTVFPLNEGGQPTRLSCASACVDVDFDSSGRLLTLSGDGAMRIYDSTLQLLREETLSTRSRHARFSPDGSRIAVSAEGHAQVDVLASQDLRLLYRPDCRAMEADSSLLAWSSSGTSLYGSGTSGSRHFIRRWSLAGQGTYVDMQNEEASISALIALPEEALAYTTSQAGFAVLAANQKLLWQHLRPLPDFAQSGSSLLVDRTASRVRISLDKTAMAWFSASDHALTRAAPLGVRYAAPQTEAPSWSISGWPQAPRNGDVALSLLPSEKARCRAFGPASAEGTTGAQPLLYVGTDRSLSAYGADGQSRWRVAIPGGVHLVNVGSDGQLVVAGLADGSIQWHSATDGHLVLTLVVDRSGERWAAFTPSGYYDAPPGGDSLFGWLVSRKNSSVDDYFRAAVFRQHRFRSDVIAQTLVVRDESRVLSELSAELGRVAPHVPIAELIPPVVRIVDPQDGVQAKEAQVALRVAVRVPSQLGPVQLRTFIQGRLTQTRGLRVIKSAENLEGGGEQLFVVSVELPPDDNTVTVIAVSGDRKSEPVSVRLGWQGARSSAKGRKPNLNVLAIGVSDYPQDDLRLYYPAKDARDLAKTLREQSARLYERVQIRELTNRNATRDNILEGLLWLRDQTTAVDVAVLFLAGHGISDSTDGRYYYLPYDADLQAPPSTMVDASQLQTALASTPGKVLLLLDTCHAGNVLASHSARTALSLSRLVGDMASADSGIVVYAASTGSQASQESPQWKNGAFTKALIEGLRGRADYGASGRVTVSALEHYVGQRVRQLTNDVQTPTTAKPTTIADFSLALIPRRRSLLRQSWFWTVIGLSVASSAATIGLAVYARGASVSGLPTLRPFSF